MSWRSKVAAALGLAGEPRAREQRLADTLAALPPWLLRHAAEPWTLAGGKLPDILAGGGWPERPAAARQVPDGVVVIEVRGVILPRSDGPGTVGLDRVRGALDVARGDHAVKGILLVIDSPGGMVTGVPEFVHVVWETARVKPVAAVADDTMLSAAYWLAAGATRIFAPTLGSVGSIGAIALHAEVTQFLERSGIRTRLFRWPRRKAEASPWEPLSEEAAADLQRQVEAEGTTFARDVASLRRIPLEVVTGTEGRALSAEEATRIGLLDAIGDADVALAWLAEAIAARTRKAAPRRAKVIASQWVQSLVGPPPMRASAGPRLVLPPPAPRLAKPVVRRAAPAKPAEPAAAPATPAADPARRTESEGAMLYLPSLEERVASAHSAIDRAIDAEARVQAIYEARRRQVAAATGVAVESPGGAAGAETTASYNPVDSGVIVVRLPDDEALRVPLTITPAAKQKLTRLRFRALEARGREGALLARQRELSELIRSKTYERDTYDPMRDPGAYPTIQAAEEARARRLQHRARLDQQLQALSAERDGVAQEHTRARHEAVVANTIAQRALEFLGGRS